MATPFGVISWNRNPSTLVWFTIVVLQIRTTSTSQFSGISSKQDMVLEATANVVTFPIMSFDLPSSWYKAVSVVDTVLLGASIVGVSYVAPTVISWCSENLFRPYQAIGMLHNQSLINEPINNEHMLTTKEEAYRLVCEVQEPAINLGSAPVEQIEPIPEGENYWSDSEPEDLVNIEDVEDMFRLTDGEQFDDDIHGLDQLWDVSYEEQIGEDMQRKLACAVLSLKQPHLPFGDYAMKDMKEVMWFVSKRNTVEYLISKMREVTVDGTRGEEEILRKCAYSNLKQYTTCDPRHYEAVVVAALRYFTLYSPAHSDYLDLKEAAQNNSLLARVYKWWYSVRTPTPLKIVA
jgi:hypothetical protein